VADVAGGEYAGHAGFQRERRAGQGPRGCGVAVLGRSLPVRTNPCSSPRIWGGSEPVCGTAPISITRAPAGMVRVLPVLVSTRVRSPACRCLRPRRSGWRCGRRC
jgi:hypothetical protein